MKAPEDKVSRKPLLSIECESEEQKAYFNRIAAARGVGIAPLVRLLLLDEGRRLGFTSSDEQAQLNAARYRKLLLLKGIDPDTDLPY